MRRDLEKVSGTMIDTPMWYGGEYLVGTKAQFNSLSKVIDACWPRYVNHIADLHHIGDEMVVSAALGIAKKNKKRRGWACLTLGSTRELRGGGRHVLASCKSRLPKWHIPHYCIFLQTKTFLHLEAWSSTTEKGFLSDYREHAKGKIFRRRLFSFTETLRGRPRRFVGRLC